MAKKMNNWIKKVEHFENEADFWKEMLNCLYEDGELSEKCYDCLAEFLSSEGIEEILNVSLMSEDKKRQEAEELVEYLDGYHRGYQELFGYMSIQSGSEQTSESCRKSGANEGKYIANFFQKAVLFQILYQICRDKCARFRASLENRTVYRRYGKKGTQDGDNHGFSVVEDLVVGNVQRGKFYQRIPKDLTDKVEYNYDKNGAYIMGKWYRDVENLHSIVFLFHSKTYIFYVSCICGESYYSIIKIGIAKYRGEIITVHENAMFSLMDKVVREIDSQQYYYCNGVLSMFWWERYHFPYEELNREYFLGILSREQFLFDRNEEGHLVGYKCQEYIGDSKREGVGSLMGFEISKKKQADTGPEAARWRRPNYFTT